MRLFFWFINYRISAITAPAPSAARLAHIMVPTRGGPCRAPIGQPSHEARRCTRW